MNRRSFVRTMAGGFAATSLEHLGAQTATPSGVKTVRTSVLEIGFHETGPASGFPVILLHTDSRTMRTRTTAWRRC